MKPIAEEKPKKSVGDFFVKHFQNICLKSSMHGAFYLAKPGLYFFERVLWFLLLLLCGHMIFYWTSIFIVRHVETPLHITIQRDHINWETFLPVITLCEQDKVNETAVEEFIRGNNPRNPMEQEFFLRALINLSFDNLHLGLPDYTEIDPRDYLKIIHQLSNHHENFVSIQTASKEKLRFKLDQIQTEMGPCSIFNTRALNTLSWEYLLNGTWQADQPVFKTFYAQGEVEGSLLDINETSPHDIFFHSPLGVPIPTQRIHMSNDSIIFTHLQFSTLDIVTHVKVKKLYQMQRKCLFFYEGLLRHSPHVYSHELCLRECRINEMKRLCGCLPPFYRVEGRDEIYCPPKNISCIGDHLSEITNATANCPLCYKSCDDTQFHLTKVQKAPWLRKNCLRWDAVPSKSRFLRSVQFSMVDLLVAFGGCTGFFMGISVLSVTEFFFFYFIEVFRAYKKYFNSP